MKRMKRSALAIGALLLSIGFVFFATGGVHATDATNRTETGTTGTTSSTSTSSTSEGSDKASTEAAARQERLQTIINKGSEEITRRLSSLNEANARINAAVKLTATDKAYLSTEVETEISGLSTVKTALGGDTTVTAAHDDAVSVINDYRVYALVMPKVFLVRRADDQQALEDKLSTLAQKLQTRLNEAKTKGKDVAVLQTKLDDMVMQIKNAQTVSSSVESKVLTLQPADYNSNHTILGGYNDQLKTARTDLETAYADARAIIAALKSL